MDQEQKQNNINEYDFALETTPVSARSFLWSPAYKNIIQAIAKKFSFSKEQEEVLNRAVFESVIGILDAEETIKKLSSLGLSEGDSERLNAYVREYIITPILTKIEEENAVSEEENDVQGESVVAPSPLEALSAIQERLKQSSIATPVKRDLSIERSGTASSAEKKQERPGPDPYRELPEVG